MSEYLTTSTDSIASHEAQLCADIAIPRSNAEEMAKLIKCFQMNLENAKYKRASIKLYSSALSRLLKQYHSLVTDTNNVQELLNIIILDVSTGAISRSYGEVYFRSIKLFHKHIHHSVLQATCLPKSITIDSDVIILSRKELQAMLESTNNLKHRCIIYTAYGAGLRPDELRTLRVQSIDLNRNYIGIPDKHKRRIPIQNNLSDLIREYYTDFDPGPYFLEGRKHDTPMSDKALQLVVQGAAKRVGIVKHVTLQTLRHTYGAHLFEQGVGLEQVSTLMGYNCNRTAKRLQLMARHRPISLNFDLSGM